MRGGNFEVERITKEGVYIYLRRKGDSVIRVIINRTKEPYIEKLENVILSKEYDNGVLDPYGFAILGGLG